MAVLTKQTSDDLNLLARWWGINLDSDRKIIRHAIDQAPDSFATTLAHLAAAIRQDERHGTQARMEASMAEWKADIEAGKIGRYLP